MEQLDSCWMYFCDILILRFLLISVEKIHMWLNQTKITCTLGEDLHFTTSVSSVTMDTMDGTF